MRLPVNPDRQQLANVGESQCWTIFSFLRRTARCTIRAIRIGAESLCGKISGEAFPRFGIPRNSRRLCARAPMRGLEAIPCISFARMGRAFALPAAGRKLGTFCNRSVGNLGTDGALWRVTSIGKMASCIVTIAAERLNRLMATRILPSESPRGKGA